MDGNARARWSEERPGGPHAVDAACIAPWVSLEFDPAGIVYACCANLLYPLGRIGDDRLADLWNGPRAQVLKEALERWDLSVGCALCRWHLEHGRDAPEMAIYDPLDLSDPDPVGPVSMTFALSNRCNLACAMCTPELSSTIRHRAGLPRLEPPYDDDFFADLEPFLPGLRHAKFLGGEPFLAPEHVRVWDLLDRAGASPRLHVTTNGTIWNDRVERLVNEYVVDLAVSVDGSDAATYESVRDGANFADLCANLDRFIEVSRRTGAHLHLNFCLMPQTAHDLHRMLAWGDRLGVPVHTIAVSDPGFALHELATAELEQVAAAWEADAHAAGLDLNAEEWEVQVRQLDAVLADRRNGVTAPTGQATTAGPDLIRSLIADLPSGERAVEGEPGIDAEHRRLRNWSGGGPVGICRIGEDGTVADVAAIHPRLGIDRSIEGRPADELLAVVESADGRTAWTVESVQIRPGVSVRGVVLAEERPSRGGRGSVVRFVGVEVPHGSVVLVAEDRFYDRPASVPVTVVPRAAGPSD